MAVAEYKELTWTLEQVVKMGSHRKTLVKLYEHKLKLLPLLTRRIVSLELLYRWFKSSASSARYCTVFSVVLSTDK